MLLPTPNHTPLQIPRWEWRTIASSLGELRKALVGVPFETIRDINETYLLCTQSSHNAKIRNGVVDLKWRKQVHPDGPELWDRVLGSHFPCRAEFIVQLFQTWGIELVDLRRESYTLDQFLNEIVALHPALLALPVHKQEEAFSHDGAACAFQRIEAGDLHLEGFRIEHEDPTLIADALRGLGLEGQENVNYPEALKHALGLIPT